MGMDVYGKKPKSEVGKYFRNNVWWWRPLWIYCCDIAPELTKGVSGDTNDGDGLGSRGAAQLAAKLWQEVESGRCAEYAKQYKKEIEALPLEECEICKGTGKRDNPPMTGPGEHECNGCNSTGKKKPWAAHYPFSEANVKEFVEFLRESGGFEIC